MRRVVLGAFCVPVILLAGCPDAGGNAAAGRVPAGKTAPAIDARNAPVAGGAVTVAAGQGAGASAALSPQQLLAQQQQARRVQALSQQVDKSYGSGVQNYRAGRLDAARLDFDFAVDLMLTSGVDIKNDAALSDEFERTVNAVNSLEMDALKQGNGFSPKVEETPVEVAGDLTFPPADAAATAKLRGELNVQSDLPLVINDDGCGLHQRVCELGVVQGARCGESWQRAGRFSRVHSAGAEGRGRAAGSDLPGGGGEPASNCR